MPDPICIYCGDPEWTEEGWPCCRHRVDADALEALMPPPLSDEAVEAFAAAFGAEGGAE